MSAAPGKGLRVGIAVPSHDKMDAMFAYDLAKLTAFMGGDAASPDGIIDVLSINFITGTYIEMARQDFAEEAIRQELDYVLWLDADMRFPRDAFYRLLLHNKEMVGINYSRRGLPPNFVAIKTIGDEKDKIPMKLATGPDSTGLDVVEAIGFGVTLMRTSVLHRLHNPKGPEGPWFMNAWSAETSRRIGEDVYFCRLVRNSGGVIHVDHDLSKECAHIGQFEYKTDHAWAFLEGHFEDGTPLAANEE